MHSSRGLCLIVDFRFPPTRGGGWRGAAHVSENKSLSTIFCNALTAVS